MTKLFTLLFLSFISLNLLNAQEIIEASIPYKKVTQNLQATFNSIENEEKFAQCIANINQNIQETIKNNKFSTTIHLGYGNPCSNSHFKQQGRSFLTVDEEDIGNYLSLLLQQKGYKVQLAEHKLLISF